MRGGVAGVRGQCCFQRIPRLLVVAALGVQHGKIVVRLGQLRIVAGQIGERLERIVFAAELDQHQRTREPRLGVLGRLLEVRVEDGQCLLVLSAVDQGLGLIERGGAERAARNCEDRHRSGDPENPFHAGIPQIGKEILKSTVI